MRIQQVAVKKLFGIFDHTIRMKLDSRITIMYGPNGFGKTILLRMMNDLFNANFKIFYSIPFEDFQIELDDGGILTVVKNVTPLAKQMTLFDEEAEMGLFESVDTTQIVIRWENTLLERSEQFTPLLITPRHLRTSLSIIDKVIPELQRIGGSRWLNTVSGETLDIYEVAQNYGYRLRMLMPHEQVDDIPDWFKQFTKKVSIRFIKANRLYQYKPTGDRYNRYNDESTTVPTVRQYSDEITKTIQQVLAGYAELSQSLDRSFPIRVIEKGTAHALTPEELQSRLEKLEVERSRLMELGLLDKDENTPDIPHLADDEDIISSVLSI